MAGGKKKPGTPRAKKREFIHDGFRHYLCGTFDGFSVLKLPHQIAMADMIVNTPLGFREHSLVEGWASFSAKELERKFGRNGFTRLNKKVQAFQVVDDWSYIEGQTKAYRLTAKAAELRTAYFSQRARPAANLCGEDGKIRKTVPKNALAAKIDENKGNGMSRPTWKGAPVLAAVPVNMTSLQSLADFLTSELDAFSRGLRSDDEIDAKHAATVLAEVQAILEMANNTLAPGCVIHRYEVSANGRLYAQGVNLQNCNRQVRFAAFTGLWDYDVENCHFAILQQLAEKTGYKCSAITAYLADKASVRKRISEDLQLTIQQVKQVLLSIAYGASQAYNEKAAIPKNVGGVEIASRLYQHPLFRAIMKDVVGARKSIMNTHSNAKGKLHAKLTNACGLTVTTEGKKVRQLLAHLLQGVEGQALEAMHAYASTYAAPGYSTNVLLLQHDGFTAVRPDVSLVGLEAAIYEKTGYRLKVARDDQLGVNIDAVLHDLDKRFLPTRIQPKPSMHAG